ncbi:putative enoyl-CoA hydratase echA8 [Paraburkholderia caffeinitolerans]|uniref:Putative enoyl-CoA hydratase echA8 n=1 Tax=Paraburkholderia caffeinitolerans TaxID=1723730 RepID=A0A6J5GJR7_9BURK|nr:MULTISPECIES: crotonase/enoyl-CoA hydratase family protein [Paraburkholderia]CAB3802044.1 putative enoyl-CoA hydratase echA8 [Paraburkholderia caffeinitolerans]
MNTGHTHSSAWVEVAIVEGVADVRLNRADKMNALNPDMFDALIATGERLAGAVDLRAVVLSGNGKGFCAGLDMQSMATLEQTCQKTPLAERTHGLSNDFQTICTLWRELPVPVIAAVHGMAFGGGLQLALGADMRYVTPDARLSVMETRWGLVPDMGGMVLTRDLVRDDRLRELIYTARIVSGAEAVELGLATRVADDPLALAFTTAREIAQRSPDAIRAAKRLLQVASRGDAAATLIAESVEQEALIGGANQREAVAANMEKRAPNFVPALPYQGSR